MPLNDDIVDIEKSEKIGSLNFVLDYFSRILLRPSIFTIKYSSFA